MFRGKRAYTLCFQLKNSPRVRRLGLSDTAHLSFTDARKLAKEKLRDIDLGREPPGERVAPDVRARAESYIDGRGADFRQRTITGYQQMTKRLP